MTSAMTTAPEPTVLDKPVLEKYDRRLEPMRAARAFQKLMADKEDTTQVFVIMEALTGRSTTKGYARLLASPGGGRIAYAQEELSQRFSDRDWLKQFAPGTVGAAYRDFMWSENLSAEGLAMESRKVEAHIDDPHVYAWYSRRLRDIHDVWHVLTGYGRDALGEACVVSFSYGQTQSLGFAFIGLGAAQEIHRENGSVPARRAVLEAWRNGRRAAWLPAVNYAELFAEPLEDARRRLNIRTPATYASVTKDVRDALKLRAA
ncbi:ubiquinone biosynthesis protein COQ4 [Caulobacter sp. 17J65-9]|uniref:ubiquinone biosynthesis protein COQ4 n=1 Tax=Caulobacter sp. 17J65-9 TaxID=2709382 RepID=UPI001F08B86E|nr:ubiquinone biosynthesis protein COQ4 [Caulobacter sp. 17J65-9]